MRVLLGLKTMRRPRRSLKGVKGVSGAGAKNVKLNLNSQMQSEHNLRAKRTGPVGVLGPERVFRMGGVGNPKGDESQPGAHSCGHRGTPTRGWP